MSSSTHKQLAVSKVSQEIWDSVAYKLPSVIAVYAARALRFKIRPQQQAHIDLWKLIFLSEAWLSKVTTTFGLNPVLIGRDLEHCLYTGPTASSYLVLVAGDRTGDLMYAKEVLMRSLVPHDFDEETMEVEFPSGLRLNIANAYRDDEMPAVEIPKLFSSTAGRRLRTAYLWWEDSGPKLRSVGTEGIVGMGGKAKWLRKIQRVCGITLTKPDRGEVQYIFEKQGLRQGVGHRAIVPVNVPVRGAIEGWKWS